jgi:hypothetical protein
MDDNDDGWFTYETSAPLCIKPSPELSRQSMTNVINNYLRSSATTGLKHHNCILDSGLTAGEAALLYFRNTKSEQHQTSSLELLEFVRQAIQKNLGFDPNDHLEIFHKHLGSINPNESNLDAKLSTGIKMVLRDTKMNIKGYTLLLKKIVQDVNEAREKKT